MLAQLASDWPAARLAEVWNRLPGVKPIRKFQDRATGVRRVWQALQSQRPEGVPGVAPPAASTATKKPRAGKQAGGGEEAPAARDGGKKGLIPDLIRQSEGATLAAIREATGWQAHSVRGLISGTLDKKMG